VRTGPTRPWVSGPEWRDLGCAIAWRDQQAGTQAAVAGQGGSPAQRVAEAAPALGNGDEHAVEGAVPGPASGGGLLGVAPVAGQGRG
jgi:hypothetical protein